MVLIPFVYMIKVSAAFVTGEILRYLSMLFVYGGAVAQVVAIFTITPQTANGTGAWFKVPETGAFAPR